MKAGDFVISVEFAGGPKITVTSPSEFLVEPGEGQTSASLSDNQLDLIQQLQRIEQDCAHGDG